MKFSIVSTRGFTLLTIVLLAACLSGTLSAQTGTSAIRGTVTDPQGNAVAGASVTVANSNLGITRTQVSGSDGGVLITALPPGNYKVSVEANGFKKSTLDNVRAGVDSQASVAIQLEIGNVSEVVSISVNENEVLSGKEDATIGNVIVPRQILQLPIESQNINTLLSLQPGVTQDGYVAGARSDQSNITLDGIDVNEEQTNEAFNSVLRSTTSSVEEFRVTVTNANANQGRSSGAQISLVTKSGTNDFHGTLYEYNRTDATAANDFFNNRLGRYTAADSAVQLGTAKVGDQKAPRPHLVRNVFGGAVGGPIVKNKLFFFYNYEGFREATAVPTVQSVPLASLGQGIVRFPNTSGGVTSLSQAQFNALFPVVMENPAGLAFLANAARKYPVNTFETGDGYNTGGFRFNAPTSTDENTHIARLDYNLNSKHTLFFRGTLQRDFSSGAQYLPDTPHPTTWSHPLGFVLGHTWTLGNNMVNVFRYGLTREAFSFAGDSSQNSISFRSIFQQYAYSRSLSRVTPVTNFTDDFSWILGNHNLQFGTNIRLIRNHRVSAAKSFDPASTNYFFYSTSALVGPIAGYSPDFRTSLRAAVAAVIGRYSQYSENFNYNLDKTLTAPGTPVPRTFATEQYDVYGQDSWKPWRNLTVNYGLRYGVGTPVYETEGYMAKPSIPLGDFFDNRVAGSFNGTPYNTLITVDVAGKKYGKTGYYHTDWNNFQPRVSAAWSPDFKRGVLHKLFGGDGDSVIRGGFAMTNDNFGQALAVNFEGNNQLGFSTQTTIPFGSFNTTTRPGPRFTGLDQTIRGLPNITVSPTVSFPQLQPADMARRIEGSLDETLQTPVNYTWNVSYGRKLPAGFYVEASYIGRKARHLLATRDVATPNNLRDPRSGVDWYTAATQLEILRASGASISSIPNIPFFQNIFGPNFLANEAAAEGDSTFLSFTNNAQGFYYMVSNDGYGIGNDWTTIQDIVDSDQGTSYFYNPQYGALAAYSTIGKSDYHGMTISVRERFKDHLTVDLNYTLSHSFDTASGLQTSGVYGAAIILNPFTPNIQRAVSDFDVRHVINANAVWQLPIGRSEFIGRDMPRFVDGIIGGWQLSAIYRWNSGYPVGAPFDSGTWATNWEIQSNGARIRPIDSHPTRGGNGNSANLFSDPVAAYRSFRSARPGEAGDRNLFRYPNYVSLDLGLAKTFKMPFGETQKLQFRWDVFNVTNTQRLTGIEEFSLALDPFNGTPDPKFGNFTNIQGSPRVMQFALRYTF